MKLIFDLKLLILEGHGLLGTLMTGEKSSYIAVLTED